MKKNLWKACMFAKSMIKKHNAYNDAYLYVKYIKIAAGYYGESVEDVKAGICEINSGIKAKRNTTKKNTERAKYKYFTCCTRLKSCEGSSQSFNSPCIKRALDRENIERLIYSDNTGSYYDTEEYLIVINEYASKAEAEAHLKEDFKKIKAEEY